MSLADFIGYLEKIIFVNLIRKIDLLTNSIHILIIARLISINAKDTPNRSAFHKYKYIIRSFVNGGADLSGGSLSTCIRSFRPVGLFYGGPQRNFCRYGILSLYSLDRGDTRAFSGV